MRALSLVPAIFFATTTFVFALPDGGGGLAALTQPVLEGFANPLLGGAGRGVAGAAAGTQQVTDLLGDAAAELAHVLGGIGANAEQGAGVAVANAAPAVQQTVQRVQENDGALGDVAKIVAG